MKYNGSKTRKEYCRSEKTPSLLFAHTKSPFLFFFFFYNGMEAALSKHKIFSIY